jgi:hypothetical protein
MGKRSVWIDGKYGMAAGSADQYFTVSKTSLISTQRLHLDACGFLELQVHSSDAS